MMPSSSSIPAVSSSSSSSITTTSNTTTTTSSPCAACKLLRRKCQPDCVFAPYFPPDNPQKFVHVHRVFGASNVTKILNELPTCHREDAVNSLAYEADMRLKDPVYGCVGVISILQHQLRCLQQELVLAKAELSKYQNHHHQQQQQHATTAAAMGPATVTGAGGGGQFLNMGYQNYHHQLHQQQQHQQMNMMARNNNNNNNNYYDGGMAIGARMGLNVNVNLNSGEGGYDGMVGTNIGIGVQFLKGSSNGGGEERQTVGPS